MRQLTAIDGFALFVFISHIFSLFSWALLVKVNGLRNYFTIRANKFIEKFNIDIRHIGPIDTYCNNLDWRIHTQNTIKKKHEFRTIINNTSIDRTLSRDYRLRRHQLIRCEFINCISIIRHCSMLDKCIFY